MEVLDGLRGVLVEELDDDGAVCSVDRRCSHGATVSESRERLWYVISLPERAVRALVGTLGGGDPRERQVLLPRFVRRSRLYEATAKNALRIAVEAVGRAEPAEPPEISATRSPSARRPGTWSSSARSRPSASPHWLLARVRRPTARGSTASFVDEPEARRRPRRGAGDRIGRRAPGGAGERLGPDRGPDRRPPLELAELRLDARRVPRRRLGPSRPEGARRPVRRAPAEAARERGSLLEVSVGMGMAFLLSARKRDQHAPRHPLPRGLGAPSPEGFAAYARRVGAPYARAVGGHFDPKRPSWTERPLLKPPGPLEPNGKPLVISAKVPTVSVGPRRCGR